MGDFDDLRAPAAPQSKAPPTQRERCRLCGLEFFYPSRSQRLSDTITNWIIGPSRFFRNQYICKCCYEAGGEKDWRDDVAAANRARAERIYQTRGAK